jgi:hypothetical protein
MSDPKKPALPGIQITNIRASAANDWLGECTPKGSAWERFCDVPHALRATGKLLLTYQRRGARTPFDLASVYAPPAENDTASYARALAKALGAGIRDAVDLSKPELMAKALAIIALLETGTRVTPDQVAAAIALLFGHAS